jgi:hypothetical protein
MAYISATALQRPIAEIMICSPVTAASLAGEQAAFIILTAIMPLHKTNGEINHPNMPALINFCTAKRGHPVTLH